MASRLFLIIAGSLFPAAASAHAFGQTFALPLPLSFYMTGGMAAFLASCALLFLFSDPMRGGRTGIFEFRVPGMRIANFILGALGVLLFAACVALAVSGKQNYALNPLPNLFWVVFLLLFAYLAAFIGGIWEKIDPFRAIARVAAHGIPDAPPPAWLPYFPFALFLALMWLELFSYGLGASPIVLGAALVGYAALSNGMSMLLGANTWLRHGDLFSALFGLFSRIAPMRLKKEGMALSLPGSLLVRDAAPHLGVLLLILAILTTTILDGVRETQMWADALMRVPAGLHNSAGIAALSALPFLLLALYSLAMLGMRRLTRSPRSVPELSLRFAYSLVPIAAAYHFAHYFGLLLNQGQAFLAQASDPLNRGWDVFGTAALKPNITLVGADTVWYIQLLAIITGHVFAAAIAHRISQRTFYSRREVMQSQLPMLVLMVGLTALGLWTLAQPFAQTG